MREEESIKVGSSVIMKCSSILIGLITSATDMFWNFRKTIETIPLSLGLIKFGTILSMLIVYFVWLSLIIYVLINNYSVILRPVILC